MVKLSSEREGEGEGDNPQKGKKKTARGRENNDVWIRSECQDRPQTISGIHLTPDFFAG